jgi:hypothetical protein
MISPWYGPKFESIAAWSAAVPSLTAFFEAVGPPNDCARHSEVVAKRVCIAPKAGVALAVDAPVVLSATLGASCR